MYILISMQVDAALVLLGNIISYVSVRTCILLDCVLTLYLHYSFF